MSFPARPFRPTLETLEDRLTPTALPAGFSETTFAGGIAVPTAMDFAPDGRLFVLEQTGNVRVVSTAGVLQTTPFLSLTVDSAVNSNDGRKRPVALWSVKIAVYLHSIKAPKCDVLTDTHISLGHEERMQRVVVYLEEVGERLGGRQRVSLSRPFC